MAKVDIHLNRKQLDLIGESVLAKIQKDRAALDMLTCQGARTAIMREIDDLNCILQELTKY